MINKNNFCYIEFDIEESNSTNNKNIEKRQ